MAYTPLVTVMATLVTIITFLEGFGRARLHRSIDHVAEHSQTLLTELTKAAVPFARSEAYKEVVRRDFESPFRLPRSATVIRFGMWVAVPISATLFGLLVSGLASSGSSLEINPANWNPLFTAALVLFIAQVALAVLTFTDSRENERELARARAVFVARLVNEAEKTLHGELPPDVETAQLWADAVAGTEVNLPQDDPTKGVLRSIEARFHLSAALGLKRNHESGTDTAGVTPRHTALQLLQEHKKARELLEDLPSKARNVDSCLAEAVLLSIDHEPNAADALWDAAAAFDVARPPRWLLVHDPLAWEEVIEQHSVEDPDVLTRWRLGNLAELLLYAGARDPKQRREHCLLAAKALHAACKPSEVTDALRATFEACETPKEAKDVWSEPRVRHGFASAAVLVPLIQTAANRDATWQKEAARTVSNEAVNLPADPVGWMAVINELRSSKLSKATTVLGWAFPDKSATEALLAWLILLDESEPNRAESEAMNLSIAWLEIGADRTAVNQQTLDAVVGLLARSSEEFYRDWGEHLKREAASWTVPKTGSG